MVRGVAEDEGKCYLLHSSSVIEWPERLFRFPAPSPPSPPSPPSLHSQPSCTHHASRFWVWSLSSTQQNTSRSIENCRPGSNYSCNRPFAIYESPAMRSGEPGLDLAYLSIDAQYCYYLPSSQQRCVVWVSIRSRQQRGEVLTAIISTQVWVELTVYISMPSVCQTGNITVLPAQAGGWGQKLLFLYSSKVAGQAQWKLPKWAWSGEARLTSIIPACFSRPGPAGTGCADNKG